MNTRLEDDEEWAIRHLQAIGTNDQEALLGISIGSSTRDGFDVSQLLYAQTRGYLTVTCTNGDGVGFNSINNLMNQFDGSKNLGNYMQLQFSLAVKIIKDAEKGGHSCTTKSESTGNSLVDGILQRLSFSTVTFGSTGEGEVAFSSYIFHAIIGRAWDFYAPCNDQVTDRCLPEDLPITLSRNFQSGRADGQRCFKIARPRGLFGCAFDLGGSGLEADIQAAWDISLAGSFIKSPRTPKKAAWPVDSAKLLAPRTDASAPPPEAEDYQKLVYTLYVRLANTLVQQASSQAYVKPEPLAMYQHNPGFLAGFDSFDLGPRRKHEVRFFSPLAKLCTTDPPPQKKNRSSARAPSTTARMAKPFGTASAPTKSCLPSTTAPRTTCGSLS